jgi:hypothetical protein
MLMKPDFFFSIAGCAYLALPTLLPAAPQEFFVSPGGSETNNGTESAPWPSVAIAFSHAAGGDIITLLPGIYSEAVVVELSGTSEFPTTIRSRRKWDAILKGSPSHGIYVADGVTNVLIDGLRVAGAGIDGIKVGSYATVRNCWIHHSTRAERPSSTISLKTTAPTRSSTTACISAAPTSWCVAM